MRRHLIGLDMHALLKKLRIILGIPFISANVLSPGFRKCLGTGKTLKELQGKKQEFCPTWKLPLPDGKGMA